MTSFNTGSKVLDNALLTVAAPVLRFIETGIHEASFTVDDPAEREGVWAEGAISSQQTTRVVREVARELKRPFVAMYAFRDRWSYKSQHSMAGTTYYSYGKPWRGYQDIKQLPKPVFSHAYVRVPRRKYAFPLVAPLLLAAPETPKYAPTTVRNKPGYKPPTVTNYSGATYWRFQIYNEEMWDSYRASMDRPEMREARRMPPL
jgi:hypothetical protein